MTAESGRPEGPEYRATARAIMERLDRLLGSTPPSRIVIGVAGESGSGKTVTALALARELEERHIATVILHQDDYFHLPPRTNHERRRRDLSSVGPQEVDLDRIQEHVDTFRAGGGVVQAPVVDYPGNRFDVRPLDLGAASALLVEGTYVLRLRVLDARIFLTATHEQTRARREARARDPFEPFVDAVLAIEHRLIAPQKELADIVIDPDFRISP